MAAMQLVLSVAVFLACQAAGQRPRGNTGPYPLGPDQCPSPCEPIPGAELPCMLDWLGCTRKQGLYPRPDVTGSCLDYSPGGVYPRWFDRYGCTGFNPDELLCEFLGWNRFRNGALYPEALDPEGKTAICRYHGPGVVFYKTVFGTYYPSDMIVQGGSSGQGTSGSSLGGAASGAAGALGGAASGAAGALGEAASGAAGALGGAASGASGALGGAASGAAGALGGAGSSLAGGAGALGGAGSSLTGGAGGVSGAGSSLPGATGGVGGAGSSLPGATGGVGGAGSSLPGATGGVGGAGSSLPGGAGVGGATSGLPGASAFL